MNLLTRKSLYQSFDAIDGKQCFRTQNCEVEEFADHAADSISTTLNTILLAALQMGKSPLLGITHLLLLSAFYGAHWAALIANSFALGSVGVSEAQCIMIAIYLITAIGPLNMWTHKILMGPFDVSIGARELVGIGWLQCWCSRTTEILQLPVEEKRRHSNYMASESHEGLSYSSRYYCLAFLLLDISFASRTGY
jgi:hypothetical protein